jgi:hypothetical protein
LNKSTGENVALEGKLRAEIDVETAVASLTAKAEPRTSAAARKCQKNRQALDAGRGGAMLR